MTDRPAIKPLEFLPYPEDGGTVTEGYGEKRQFLSRALPPTGGAIFIMVKDGVYSFDGIDDESTYASEAEAIAAANVVHASRIRSCLLDKPEAVEGEPVAWRRKRDGWLNEQGLGTPLYTCTHSTVRIDRQVAESAYCALRDMWDEDNSPSWPDVEAAIASLIGIDPSPSQERRTPLLAERLRAILDWCDLALKHPGEFDSHGVRLLDGPVFDEARAALSTPADTDAAQSEIDRLRRELEEARRALERASEAGWNACRRQVYLLSEDYIERTHELKGVDTVEGNFYRGQYDVAKSFAKAFSAFEARDCDYFQQIDFAALSSAGKPSK